MTRPAILIHLDVCPCDKCPICGGVAMPHRKEVVWHGNFGWTSGIRKEECHGGPDDTVCEHRFCVDCEPMQTLLKDGEEDMCEKHQLIYDMVKGERRR